ncbi:unnamed protein product, partial [marine sediment metagenome]
MTPKIDIPLPAAAACGTDTQRCGLGRPPPAPAARPIAASPAALRPPSRETVPSSRQVSPAGPLPSSADSTSAPQAIVRAPDPAPHAPPTDVCPANRIVRDLRPRARVLTLASGKGGV